MTVIRGAKRRSLYCSREKSWEILWLGGSSRRALRKVRVAAASRYKGLGVSKDAELDGDTFVLGPRDIVLEGLEHIVDNVRQQ